MLSFSGLRRPRRSRLFPYTTLFRSGRDVESMVRELVDVAINMVRTEREDDVYPQAETRAEERLLDLLLPPTPTPPLPSPVSRSEEHTSELQSLTNIVCRLLLEKKTS